MMEKKVYIIPRIEFDPIENDDELMAASGPAEYRLGEDNSDGYNGNIEEGPIGVVDDDNWNDFILE